MSEVNPKREESTELPLTYSFSQNLFSLERPKPCFFVTFNIIMLHSPENFIEIRQIAQQM